jgi:hypothetical protein
MRAGVQASMAQLSRVTASLGAMGPGELLRVLFTYFVLCLLFVPFIYISLSVNKGIDFSDAGFYYNSIVNFRSIDMQTTQFAIVWNLLPIPDSVIAHRLAVLVILAGSSYLLLSSAWCFVTRRQWLSPIERFQIAAIAAIAIVPFYRAWLPDPSYNSVGYSLTIGLLGLAFRVTPRLAISARAGRVELVVAGALALALLLTKPIAPIICLIGIVPLVLVAARPSLATLIRALGWLALGIVFYLIVQLLLVEPIWDTLARIQGGLLRRELLGNNGVLQIGFERFKDMAVGIFERHPVTLVVLIGLVVSIHLQHRLVSRSRAMVQTIGFLLLAIIVGRAAQTLLSDGMIETYEAAPFTFLLGVALGVGSILVMAVLALTKRAREESFRSVIATLVLLVGSVACFFGTTNNWINSWYGYSGILLIALILLTARPGKKLGGDWQFVGLLLVMAAVALPPVWTMTNTPYRLATSLPGQTVPVANGRWMWGMRVDAQTGELLEHLAVAEASIQPTDERPLLIDLSGRLPLAAHQLGATHARSPWLLSGRPGSQTLFDFTMASLEPDDLRAAWILEAPDWPRSMDTSILTRSGLNFPDDYELVFDSWSPYIRSRVRLWAPKVDCEASDVASGTSEILVRGEASSFSCGG